MSVLNQLQVWECITEIIWQFYVWIQWTAIWGILIEDTLTVAGLEEGNLKCFIMLWVVCGSCAMIKSIFFRVTPAVFCIVCWFSYTRGQHLLEGYCKLAISQFLGKRWRGIVLKHWCYFPNNGQLSFKKWH